MPATIWKTEINAFPDTVTVPKGAKPLSVHTQNGTPCLWWVVNPDADLEVRAIHVAGTGHELPENIGAFLGTFLIHNESLVFHVFELTQ